MEALKLREIEAVNESTAVACGKAVLEALEQLRDLEDNAQGAARLLPGDEDEYSAERRAHERIYLDAFNVAPTVLDELRAYLERRGVVIDEDWHDAHVAQEVG